MTHDPVETGVLGGIMLCAHEAIPPEVLQVEPEHFRSARHAAIWGAVQELLAERLPTDPVSIYARMRTNGDADGMTSYLLQLASDCPTAVNLDVWCRVLASEGQARLLAECIRGVVEAGGPPEEVAQRVGQVVAEAKRVETGGLQHVRKALQDLFRELQAEHADRDSNRIAKTGIPDLDRAVEMRPGHLTVIAGRPGMGKSALAGNVAQYCALDPERGATALFSLEMDACSLVKRMVAAHAQIDTRDLVTLVAKDADRLTGAFARMHRMNLYIDDRPGLSTAQMRQALQRLGKVRLVVVDYLQLAKMDAKLERQDLRVGAVTKALKAMAKDFACHVIALSQLNRAVESRTPPVPCMSDLRDSGNIEEDAENVWLLYRPGYYATGQEEEPVDPDAAQVIIGKSRHGRTGIVNVGWNGARQQFYGVERHQGQGDWHD